MTKNNNKHLQRSIQNSKNKQNQMKRINFGSIRFGNEHVEHVVVQIAIEFLSIQPDILAQIRIH